MNTLLKIAALITATATPVSFVLEAHGTSLPTMFSSGYLFGAFVAVVTVLTMIADYTGAKLLRPRSLTASTTAGKSRTSLPLAA